jgi:hypothetical protein
MQNCQAREKSIWVQDGEDGEDITLYVIALIMCVTCH